MDKLKTLSRLKKILAEHRKLGRRIVLANGCFDLFHIGHIRYLRGAKEQGDILVVGLNSDSSVRRLKGPGRPLLGQKERAEILAAFEFVDYIVIFKESNVEKILLSLRPDIHVKGSDYTEETVPEKDTVKRYGGKVAIAGGPKVWSTSELIKIIAARIRNGRKTQKG